jgi:mevalonate kinase
LTTFHSNGKLLITGEYAVLDGALSLALPTRFGQSMEVKAIEKPELVWISFDNNNQIWFETKIPMADLLNVEKPNMDAYEKPLRDLLRTVAKLKPDFFSQNAGYEVVTKLDFPRNWGLGTSSTLIYNIAQWAEVNPYLLLESSFGGSGYDIACAGSQLPVLYQLIDGKPEVEMLSFKPVFSENLFFVHLNRKQNSREGIQRYRSLPNKENIVQEISTITRNILKISTLKEFSECMEVHENLMASIIQLPKVKDLYFSDYPGAVKSLGAWGGDFVLAAGEKESPEYFKGKGFLTVIPFDEMI